MACKYWDKDDDGFNEGPDVLLSGWTITATADAANADVLTITNGASTGSSASGVTDATGCTTFTVTGFATATSSDSVTLNETLQTNWNQVAPLQGTYAGGTGGSITVTGCNFSTAPIPACTSTSDVPLTGDGTTTVAPDFGNTGIDLTVSKTATPQFTRTYAWDITKCATDPGANQTCQQNPPHVDQVGGNVTFNYTIVASETGFGDSGFKVTGAITVTNPNGFAVSGVTVNETGDGVGACTLDANGLASLSGETIPASGSKSYNYTCTYGSNPSSGTNHASATWNASTYNTPDGSASNTADYTFGSPTSSVNKTVTVTDCFNGCSGGATTLGTLTAKDTAPYTTATYHPSHTISVPANGCKSYTNVATVVLPTNPPANPTASATVTVCGPEKTGALTMGFWQNKNGQGIITSFCGGTSGTSLHAFMTSYHPFSDQTAATCSGEATYVLNVIKAASCTSTSKTCNPMLKAQMLATALDVYFSDGSLGGNRIGAPSAIGPDLIDLTQICKMIDGSGGTATCSGAFENVSSAFGGATQLSVSGMLAYQNIADPAVDAGAFWYGQVKATQVLAKDAFDAVNNQVAFAP